MPWWHSSKFGTKAHKLKNTKCQRRHFRIICISMLQDDTPDMACPIQDVLVGLPSRRPPHASTMPEYVFRGPCCQPARRARGITPSSHSIGCRLSKGTGHETGPLRCLRSHGARMLASERAVCHTSAEYSIIPRACFPCLKHVCSIIFSQVMTNLLQVRVLIGQN